MKHYPAVFLIALGGLMLNPLQGEDPAATGLINAVQTDVAPANVAQTEQLTPEQIDALLAPIALYPDPLVAIILPAATFPTDVVMAARYLNAGGDPAAIDDQTWDDSVKALARYPDVLKWMDQNLTWTQQVGAAFVAQPAAVLSAAQRLRAAAIAAGNLKESTQQHIVVEQDVVRILPAQKEVIYVPVYDPIRVYRPCPMGLYDRGPLVTFSVGYPAGYWLSYSCNWHVNTIVVIDRPYRTVIWRQYPTWSYPHHLTTYCQPWRPSPVCVQTVRREFRHRSEHRIAHPTANTFVQRRLELIQDKSPRVTERNTESSHRTALSPRISDKTESAVSRRPNLSDTQVVHRRAPETETTTSLSNAERRTDTRRLHTRAAPETTETTLAIPRSRGFIQPHPTVTSKEPTPARPLHPDQRPAALTRPDRSIPLVREQPMVRQQPAASPAQSERRTRTSLTPSDDNASTTPTVTKGRFRVRD
jgi:hypothetical protein